MSLEFEVEADVQIDIQPEIEVEVEIDVAPEIEIEVEAEVDAEIEVEVQVPCVEVEVVADADFNADLVVESNLAEPIVDVEVGGNVNTTSSGGVCNLVCSKHFSHLLKISHSSDSQFVSHKHYFLNGFNAPNPLFTEICTY